MSICCTDFGAKKTSLAPNDFILSKLLSHLLIFSHFSLQYKTKSINIKRKHFPPMSRHVVEEWQLRKEATNWRTWTRTKTDVMWSGKKAPSMAPIVRQSDRLYSQSLCCEHSSDDDRFHLLWFDEFDGEEVRLQQYRLGDDRHFGWHCCYVGKVF